MTQQPDLDQTLEAEDYWLASLQRRLNLATTLLNDISSIIETSRPWIPTASSTRRLRD